MLILAILLWCCISGYGALARGQPTGAHRLSKRTLLMSADCSEEQVLVIEQGMVEAAQIVGKAQERLRELANIFEDESDVRKVELTKKQRAALYNYKAIMDNDADWYTKKGAHFKTPSVNTSSMFRFADRLRALTTNLQNQLFTLDGINNPKHLQIYCGDDWLSDSSPVQKSEKPGFYVFDNRPSDVVAPEYDMDRSWVELPFGRFSKNTHNSGQTMFSSQAVLNFKRFYRDIWKRYEDRKRSFIEFNSDLYSSAQWNEPPEASDSNRSPSNQPEATFSNHGDPQPGSPAQSGHSSLGGGLDTEMQDVEDNSEEPSRGGGFEYPALSPEPEGHSHETEPKRMPWVYAFGNMAGPVKTILAVNPDKFLDWVKPYNQQRILRSRVRISGSKDFEWPPDTMIYADINRSFVERIKLVNLVHNYIAAQLIELLSLSPDFMDGLPTWHGIKCSQELDTRAGLIEYDWSCITEIAKKLPTFAAENPANFVLFCIAMYLDKHSWHHGYSSPLQSAISNARR